MKKLVLFIPFFGGLLQPNSHSRFSTKQIFDTLDDPLQNWVNLIKNHKADKVIVIPVFTPKSEITTEIMPIKVIKDALQKDEYRLIISTYILLCHNLQLRIGKDIIEIDDLLFPEIVLPANQINFELEAEFSAMENNQELNTIHFFDVISRFSNQNPQDEIIFYHELKSFNDEFRDDAKHFPKGVSVINKEGDKITGFGHHALPDLSRIFAESLTAYLAQQKIHPDELATSIRKMITPTLPMLSDSSGTHVRRLKKTNPRAILNEHTLVFMLDLALLISDNKHIIQDNLTFFERLLSHIKENKYNRIIISIESFHEKYQSKDLIQYHILFKYLKDSLPEIKEIFINPYQLADVIHSPLEEIGTHYNARRDAFVANDKIDFQPFSEKTGSLLIYAIAQQSKTLFPQSRITVLYYKIVTIEANIFRSPLHDDDHLLPHDVRFLAIKQNLELMIPITGTGPVNPYITAPRQLLGIQFNNDPRLSIPGGSIRLDISQKDLIGKNLHVLIKKDEQENKYSSPSFLISEMDEGLLNMQFINIIKKINDFIEILKHKNPFFKNSVNKVHAFKQLIQALSDPNNATKNSDMIIKNWLGSSDLFKTKNGDRVSTKKAALENRNIFFKNTLERQIKSKTAKFLSELLNMPAQEVVVIASIRPNI